LDLFAEEEYKEKENSIYKKSFDNEAGTQIKNNTEEREKAKNEVIGKEDQVQAIKQINILQCSVCFVYQ
jgi:hypothetical protein